VGLRMIKVSIPAYKLRGESAFLECQYELNRTHHTVTGVQVHSEHDHAHGHQSHGGEFHYPDGGEGLEEERSPYRSRMRQNQRQHGQRQRQREPIAMRQYQSQQSHQLPPAPPEKSPYGHSVYRGSAASGYLGAAHVGASTHSGSVSVSSNGGNGGGGNGGPAAYMPEFDRADSFDDSIDREEEDEEEEEEQREEGEALYAIKWYKDNEEFYRYVPKARPPKTSYRVDGVRVIVSIPNLLWILGLSVRLRKKQYIT